MARGLVLTAMPLHDNAVIGYFIDVTNHDDMTTTTDTVALGLQLDRTTIYNKKQKKVQNEKTD